MVATEWWERSSVMLLSDIFETKYLIFKRYKKEKKKTYNVKIYNKSSELLGEIYWRSGWRTYVVTYEENIDFDIKCLDDISNYIKLLLEERKIERTNLNKEKGEQ